MTSPATPTGDKGIGNLHQAMADEDERCRADIKRVAYEHETGEDPRSFAAAVEEVLAASKQRQAQIFKSSGWGS